MSLKLRQKGQFPLYFLHSSLKVNGCKRFSQDAASGNAATNKVKSESTFSADTLKLPEPGIDYQNWYKQMKKTLATGTGPYFSEKAHPFPYNPDFCPQKPLTNAHRDLVYSTWKSDSDKWTLRALSLQFKVSMERVKAVIKIKSLQEKAIASGAYKINEEYVKKMESILGAQAPTNNTENQLRNYDTTAHMSPKLIAVPEESSLDPTEAAKILGYKLKPIYKAIKRELEGDVPFNPNKNKPQAFDKKELLIRQDPYEKSRWQFVFTDISKSTGVGKAESKFVIREPNGDLRKAHSSEKFKN